MANVDLTLGESKTNSDLTLEGKGSSTITWDDATWSWDAATGTWDNMNTSLSLEAKSSVDLSLEAK